jgi:prepilin-type N-terminal cleavage/methylation domain-containing protein
MMKSAGLTIIEVIVAMALLAILCAALVGVLPSLSRNTRASTVDTVQSQAVYSTFEAVASAWTNPTAFTNETVDVGGSAVPVATFVSGRTGGECTAVVTPQPSATAMTRKRLVITCAGDGILQSRLLRAEYGDPGE